MFKKKAFLEWGVILVIFGTLYFTGLHTEAIGKLQQAVLATGVIKPELNAQVQAEASYNWKLSSSEGELLDLQDMKGKVLFINLWATWCPPCIAEMPGINNLYEEVASDDIQFLMISTDQDFEKAKKFIEKKGYSFPVYKIVSTVPREYQSRTLPTTFIISKNGEIVLKHQGMADYDNDKMKNFLTDLKNKNSDTL